MLKKGALLVTMILVLSVFATANPGRIYCFYCDEDNSLQYIKYDGDACPEGYFDKNVACDGSIEPPKEVPKEITGETIADIAEPAKEEATTWVDAIFSPIKLVYEKVKELFN